MKSATVSRCKVLPMKIRGICLFDRCRSSSAKEDVQRRVSAFRSARGVSLEAGWRGRSHWDQGQIHGGQPFPLPCWPRECPDSKHLKPTTGGYCVCTILDSLNFML